MVSFFDPGGVMWSSVAVVHSVCSDYHFELNYC